MEEAKEISKLDDEELENLFKLRDKLTGLIRISEIEDTEWNIQQIEYRAEAFIYGLKRYNGDFTTFQLLISEYDDLVYIMREVWKIVKRRGRDEGIKDLIYYYMEAVRVEAERLMYIVVRER